MNCEICQKNEATVHMARIINGKKVESYICSDCAKEIGFDSPISFQDIFQGLLNIAAASQPERKQKEGILEQKCPVCGLTDNDFRKSGKLGCAHCYKTLKPQLDSMLKNMHGGIEHKGKVPHKNGGQIMIKRKIEQLKKQLSLSISEERYEDAAMYRDKIKALEKGGEAV